MKILSLCDLTGGWSDPYRRAGYEVIQLDIQKDPLADVRLREFAPGQIRGIIAQPPCTHFASSGARWWKGKGEAKLLEALAIMDACLRAVVIHRPAWWVLENPVGRISRYLGPPALTFDPCEFAGWSEEPEIERYTKRTCLWGQFFPPQPRPLSPVLGSKMHRLPPGPDRANLRSATPRGFAAAFFEVNR